MYSGVKCSKSHPEPSLAILGNDLFAVGHPVTVPPPDCSGIVNTDGINRLDLKASAFELVDSPTKRCRRISSGKDVLVHEKTPDQILVLPWLSQTGVLHEEDTIVVQHTVDLRKETREVAHTNVLRHLKTSDFVVTASWCRDVTVVHAEDLALLFWDAIFAQSSVSPSRLIASEGSTSNASAEVLAGKTSECTPAAANIKHGLSALETDLLANNGHFVVL